jgi:hypothetical protein
MGTKLIFTTGGRYVHTREAAPKVYTPELTAMLIELAGLGHSGIAISKTLSAMAGSTITPLSVRAKAVSLGVKLRRPKGTNELRFTIETRAYDALRAAADGRGVSMTRLARQIVELVCKDHLIDAVIDAPSKSKPRPASAPRIGRPQETRAA